MNTYPLIIDFERTSACLWLVHITCLSMNNAKCWNFHWIVPMNNISIHKIHSEMLKFLCCLLCLLTTRDWLQLTILNNLGISSIPNKGKQWEAYIIKHMRTQFDLRNPLLGTWIQRLTCECYKHDNEYILVNSLALSLELRMY